MADHTVDPGVFGGIIAVLPHLADEVWQDEAYTLLNFASKGFFYPFSDYHLPNNHMLFSAILSKWWDSGDSIPYLRMLPLVFYVMSLIILAVTAEKFGGILTSVTATMMFASSTVTENFALQLRGYGASWLPVVTMLLALPSYGRSGKWYWGAIYVFAAAASVAIIPTNIVICTIFILWGWWQIIFDNKLQVREKRSRLLTVSLGPMIGFIAYIGIWQQLLDQSGKNFSSWSRIGVLQHWLWATLADFIWLVPIMLLGLIYLCKEATKQKIYEIGNSRSNLVLLILTLITVPVSVWLLPAPPFPRNFVPLLPVWFYITGVLVVSGLQFCFQKREHLIAIVFIPLTLVIFIYPFFSKPCMGIGPGDEFPQDLCRQFYHEQYYPGKTVKTLAVLTNQKAIPVISDFEGYYSLGFVMNSTPTANFNLMPYKQWMHFLKNEDVIYPPLLVTRSKIDQKNILGQLNLSPDRYTPIVTTGYFKIFGLAGIWKPETLPDEK